MSRSFPPRWEPDVKAPNRTDRSHACTFYLSATPLGLWLLGAFYCCSAHSTVPGLAAWRPERLMHNVRAQPRLECRASSKATHLPPIPSLAPTADRFAFLYPLSEFLQARTRRFLIYRMSTRDERQRLERISATLGSADNRRIFPYSISRFADRESSSYSRKGDLSGRDRYVKDEAVYILPSGKRAQVTLRTRPLSNRDRRSRRSRVVPPTAHIEVTTGNHRRNSRRSRRSHTQPAWDLWDLLRHPALVGLKLGLGGLFRQLTSQQYDFEWDDRHKDWRRVHDDDDHAGRSESLSSVGEILELPRRVRRKRKEWQRHYC